MKRLTLKHNVAQFVIDLAFGLALLTTLLYGSFVGQRQECMLIAVGLSFGYGLHMLQKVLLYEELLAEDVRDQVETEVAEKVPEEAEKEVEKEVERQVNES